MKPCEPRCSLSQDAVNRHALNIQEIRIAVHSGDARRLVEVLGGSIWTEILQLAGDALAGAAAQGVPGASELAEAWTTALRNRRSPEDDELAAELDAALGRRPPPPGQPLPVDLEELPDLLETRLGEEGGRVDLLTGEVWRASTVEYFRDEEPDDAPDFEDRGRWLYVGPEGSQESYRDMEDFVADMADPVAPTGSASPSRGAARSDASRTPSPVGPRTRNAGTGSQTSVAGVVHASG